MSNYWHPPPKFRSLVFWVLTETEHQCQPLWKNWKMAAISLISIVQKNVKLLTPQKFGSPVFFSECWWKWNIIGKPEMQIFFFLNFPLVHFSPRFHFNIYAWLHLKHLCVDIYPTSHLCVVLHFLIFHRLEKVVVGYQISQTGKYGNGLLVIILIYWKKKRHLT